MYYYYYYYYYFIMFWYYHFLLLLLLLLLLFIYLFIIFCLLICLSWHATFTFFNNDFYIYYFNLIYEHNNTSRKNLTFFTAIRSSQSKIDAATSTSLERDVAAMGCRIDPSWRTHVTIYRFSQSLMTGVTKVVVCVILSVG